MANYFIIGGVATKRMQIMNYVAMNGGATKAEIVKAIWGFDREHFNCDCGQYMTNTFRGWNCSTFAEMRKDGRLFYDKTDRKWYVGRNAIPTLIDHFITENEFNGSMTNRWYTAV